MPKFLEQDLRAEAAKKGYTGRQASRYVFGALNNQGLMKGNKETPKGGEMQKKHDPAATPKKKKKPYPKPMHSRMAAAFGKTKTSTPAEPDADDGY